MTHVDIKVEGMTCGGCVNSIQNALRQRDGVLQAAADLDGGIVSVEFDPERIGQAALEAAITDAGFDVVA
jgi:copper chaperone